MTHQAATMGGDPPACESHTAVRLHEAYRMPSRLTRGARASRSCAPRWAPAASASCGRQRYDDAQMYAWTQTMNTLSLWNPTYDKLSAHNGRRSYASGPPCEAQGELELGPVALAIVVPWGR